MDQQQVKEKYSSYGNVKWNALEKKEIEKICPAHKFLVDFKNIMNSRNFKKLLTKHYGAFFDIDQFYIFCLKGNQINKNK